MRDVYKQTVRRTVSKTVYFSESKSYPASEHGGTLHFSGQETVNIDVEINTYLDNRPVVSSVGRCSNNVDGLTASVVATETAEIASRRENSQKISNSIIRGFFGYIRSEISQQMAELKMKTESQLLHLRETAQNCIAKKEQMESDYHRISERYTKIFGELNKELKNRIQELDKPVFKTKKRLFREISKLTASDGASATTVMGKDQGSLQSGLLASNAKRKTFDIIHQVKGHILEQNKMDGLINQNTINSSFQGKHFMPVCYCEYSDNETRSNVFSPYQITKEHSNMLVNNIKDDSKNWKQISDLKKEKLNNYIVRELNSRLSDNTHDNTRIQNTFHKLLNTDSLIVN